MEENIIDIVIDEVALEGLDGITLEALFQRLTLRLNRTLPFKNGFEEQIWIICTKVKEFTFHELEEPRKKLIIFDQCELECLKKPESTDIYPYFPIEDKDNGIRGSCASYYKRKNISDLIRNLSLSEVNDKYGQSLVIVASQELRNQAIIGEEISPNLELTLVQYCLLERVGRSRYFGDISVNNPQLDSINDPKSLFYNRKILIKKCLLKKQLYFQSNSEKTTFSILVHLPKFFIKRKPKVINLLEHLVNYLKTKENCKAEYGEVKKELNTDYSLKKFFKMPLVLKIIDPDIKSSYRSYFPNSTVGEYQMKNEGKERTLRLVQLRDEKFQLKDLWKDENDDDEEAINSLNIGAQKFQVPFLKQASKLIYAKKDQGLSQMQLAEELGLTKLISRNIIRNLVRSNTVSSYLIDIGRQRTGKYVSKIFESNNSVIQKIELEISKIKEYQKSIDSLQNDSNENLNEANSKSSLPKINEQKSLSLVKDTDYDSNTSVIKFSSNNNNNNNNYNNLFKIVNNLFYKYKLSKKRNKYCYTSSSKFKNAIKLNDVENNEIISNEKKTEIIESDMYKNIETKLTTESKADFNKKIHSNIKGFIENMNKSDYIKNNHFNVSYRMIHRVNIILEVIKEHKVVTDSTKLMKIIYDQEDKEGYEDRIDRVTLLRTLKKLAKENLIKFFKLTIKTKKNQKSLHFICDPRIKENDSVIQSAVEEAKMKFCMLESQTHKNLIKDESEDTKSVIKPSVEKNITRYKLNRNIGKVYGYSPKFKRMQNMHILLYYLIYGNIRKEPLSKEFLVQNFKDEQGVNEILDLNIPVYSTDINWKMFIPPLPKHDGWITGWALLSDVICRMPLSMFIQFNNISYEIDNFEDYINHPIKKYLLIKDLPLEIRSILFIKRKYIFKVYEVVSQLCYLGLVQFGPQQLKDKDQIFVYLNKRTELLDTTSSSAGYHKVEDKLYPATKYEFTSLLVVENYWYEMWNICINTCLGGRSTVEGKNIVLEDLDKKIEMIQALKSKTPETAVIEDIGFVPGDRKGAAGIDSAFFAHLKRNWNWTNNPGKPQQSYYDNLLNRSAMRNCRNYKLNNKSRNNQNTKKKSVTFKDKNCELNEEKDKPSVNSCKILAHNVGSKTKKIVRKVLPRKQSSKNKVKYDEIDYTALQKMDKLRVDWEQHEDNILLVCKVASLYLCPNPRRNFITFIAIRDILRSYSFTSHNKTSRACQRRLNYMMKQPKTVNSVLLGVEEVKQDFYINKRFNGLVDQIKKETKNPLECDSKISKVFKDLVSYIAKKYYNISNVEQREPFKLPQTIQEFNLFYKLKLPSKIVNSSSITKNIQDISDIHTATVNSVIHSSMCCGKDRRSWAYQLFKVYQQYPEYLLKNAMLKIRADQLVTMKKSYTCAFKKFGNCLPMSSSQYQLSSTYHYKLQTKWPYEIFSEAYNSLYQVLKNYDESKLEKEDYANGIEITAGSGGILAMMQSYLSNENFKIDVEIPDQIIMLDPKLPEKDETYKRIASRYKSILDNLIIDYNLSNEESKLTENVNIDNGIEKGFEKVCSEKLNNQGVKRTIEHDYCDFSSKKIKLDSENSEFQKNDFSQYSNMETDKETELVMSNSKNNNPTFVRNIIRQNNSNTLVKSIGWKNDINDVKTRHTRIALLKMREELHDLTIHDSAHAHEYFVVNSCKLFYSLKLGKDAECNKIGHQGLNLPSKIFPLDINKITEVINDIKEFAIYPKNLIAYDEFKDQCQNENFIWKDVDRIYSFIINGKEFGATLEQILREFKNMDEINLDKILSTLVKKRIIFRVGVSGVHYVHRRYINPWLIHSYKILRLDKESHANVPEGCVYTLNNDEQKIENMNDTNNTFDITKMYKVPSKLYNNENNINQDSVNVEIDHSIVNGELLVNKLSKEIKENDESRDEENLSQKRLRRNRTVLLQQKDVYKAAKLLDFNTAEELKVIIKPWIRIDGALNRRVLDRMLGAILCYCIEQPSVSLAKVQKRFVPVLQTFHTRELVEVLVKLDCIIMSVQKSQKVTLFSQPSKIDTNGNPNLIEDSNSIILNTTMDAVLKFGTFLSTKSYTSDFLSTT